SSMPPANASRRVQSGGEGSADVEIVLTSSLAVSGGIVGAGGGPLSGGSVHDSLYGQEVGQGLSDSGGGFAFANAGHEPHVITVFAPGENRRFPRTATMVFPGKPLTIVVDRVAIASGRVSGFVLDRGGTVPTSARLLLAQAGGSASVRLLADANGR